ncbi:MAG: hypothetical protein K2X66_07580, partial [Cyanobacteria bacterium]|nr:hypothetical protein [Cyanobacteriota bacterium]
MQLTTELLGKPSRYSVEKKPVFSQQTAPVKPRDKNFQATDPQFSGCGSWDSDGFQKAPVLTNPKTVFAANLSNTDRIQSNFISSNFIAKAQQKSVNFGANRHEPTDLPVEKIIQEVRESVIDTQYIESENNDKVAEILDKAAGAMKDGKKEAFIKTELDALLENESIFIAHTENSAKEPIPTEAQNPVTKAVYKLLAELEKQTPALPLETKLEKALEQVTKTWAEVSPTLNDYDKQEVEKTVTLLNTKLQEFSYKLQQNTQAEVVYETQLIKPLQALHEAIVKAESGENEEWRDPDAEKSEFDKAQEEQPDLGEGDTMLLGPQNVAEQALEEAKKLRDRHYLSNLMKLHYKLMADPTSAEKHQRLSEFIFHKFDSLKPSAEMATRLSEVATNSPVLQIREFTTRYLHYYFAKSKASDVTEALLENQPQLLERLKINPESQELIEKKPITFKLAQDELKELPLFLYQFGHPTYDEGMHQ